MMHKCGNFGHSLPLVEFCLLNLVLSKGMKLIDQESSPLLQNSKSLQENEGKIFNVFKDKIADDQIIRCILAGPLLSEISHRKFHVFCLYFFPGLLDHALGKIKAVDMCSNLNKERCVLPCATANLKDGMEAQIGERLSRHLSIEIMRF